ncbi:MAG: hypothetical protein ACRDMV_04895 [Streptosporangiales bacterium]
MNIAESTDTVIEAAAEAAWRVADDNATGRFGVLAPSDRRPYYETGAAVAVAVLRDLAGAAETWHAGVLAAFADDIEETI